MRSEGFPSARASSAYLEYRFGVYPLYREYFDLWGDHRDNVVLEYGCGPGHDLLGFALHSGARRVIGMDVSAKSLSLTAERLAMHRVQPFGVELIQVLDGAPGIPLPDDSVDHVHCSGVLHHTSQPEYILEELTRVLAPGGTAAIMVYNRDSVFFHLMMAYVRMIIGGECAGMDPDEAFGRMTDGTECPISIAYRPEDWLAICRKAGLEGEFIGGYPAFTELDELTDWGLKALLDDRFPDEHRRFVQDLRLDAHGYPLYEGRVAGCGGSYRLYKA